MRKEKVGGQGEEMCKNNRPWCLSGPQRSIQKAISGLILCIRQQVELTSALRPPPFLRSQILRRGDEAIDSHQRVLELGAPSDMNLTIILFNLAFTGVEQGQATMTDQFTTVDVLYYSSLEEERVKLEV